MFAVFTMNNISAASATVAGTVNILRSFDSSYGSQDINWFNLNGVSNVTGCKNSEGGTVVRIKGDALGSKQYAIVLAAKLSNRKIQVGIDPADLDQWGSCYLHWINFAD